MGFGIVVVLAVLAGGAVYALTLRTLPEDGTREANVAGGTRAAEAPAAVVAHASPSAARDIPGVDPGEIAPWPLGVGSRIRSFRSALRRPSRSATPETTPAPEATPQADPESLVHPGPVQTTSAVAIGTSNTEDAEPFAEAGVLYVPVMTDRPDTNSRLMGLLGIVALVLVSGALLGFAVWQTIHVIARLLSNVTGP